jgi:hypothetical protein
VAGDRNDVFASAIVDFLVRRFGTELGPAGGEPMSAGAPP